MAALWLLCCLAAAVSLVWMFLALIAGSPRAWSIAIGYDQLGNAMTGGDEDEYISSRCWSQRDRQPFKWLRPAIDWAAAQVGDPDHCRTAWETEQAKLRRRITSASTP